MEPWIDATEDVAQLLEEAREVSEPIARGDLPHDFTVEDMLIAHTTAGRVMIHLTEKIKRGNEHIDFDDYETLRYAHQSFRTLTSSLLRNSLIDTEQRLMLTLAETAQQAMWSVFTNITIIYDQPIGSPT